MRKLGQQLRRHLRRDDAGLYAGRRDVGHTIRVEETASNSGGPGTPATSEPTAVIKQAVPVNTKLPTITGTAQQGEELTEHNGEWTNSPTGYTYKWLQCESLGGGCLPISGATGQTYTPVAGDVGHTIRVEETASNESGPGTPAISEPTAVIKSAVPVNTKLPTITGTPQQGKKLTEHNGEWTNNPTGYTYKWLQCESSGNNCAAISGATTQAYTPVAADVGHTIRVEETASNSGGPGTPATSEPTAVIKQAVPVNTKLPTITGTAQQGKELNEVHGEWTNSPTGYTAKWLQCNSSGASCTAISGATTQAYTPGAGDVGHTIRVEETASNSGGSGAPATSEPTGVIKPAAPVNTKLPSITGTSQQGKELTEVHGEWTNSPTGYSYLWQQCDGSGNNCTTIAGATAQSYTLAAGDVGHTIRVEETASNEGGSGSATSGPSAIVKVEAPKNTEAPKITGAAVQGQTLSTQNGSWTNEPTSYGYQWQRCDTTGANCSPISAATEQTYTLGTADIGSTLRVAVTATNPGGASSPASSSQTAVVQQPSTTFGKTTVGASADKFSSNHKRVNRYALPTAAAVSKLSVYLAPTTTSGQQVMKGVIYADTGTAPGALLGVSEQLTFKSTNAAGWYDLVFPSPVKLSAGNYWIGALTGAATGVAGFRYDSVAGSRDSNVNTYTSGASNPFGSVTVDKEQASLYATYKEIFPPTGITAPTISGTAQQGQTLTEVHGTWANEPTSYAYRWLQCDSSGSNCTTISGATSQTYVPVAGDLGHTIRVEETAKNAAGASAPATSTATAQVQVGVPTVVTAPTVTGTAQQGQTLTEHDGTWTGEPTGYTYQWLQCDSSGINCLPIAGATSQTYIPAAGDVTYTIEVQETASNESGASSPATSEPTPIIVPPAPVNSKPPMISGTAQQGQTLTEENGEWTNEPTGYTYQWLECDSSGNNCTAISGATSQTYVVLASDVGNTIRVEEIASNEGGEGSPATSNATTTVIPLPPANNTPPTITGTPQQGKPLEEHHGTWTNGPTSFTYQWLQCEGLGGGCLPIPGATGQTYVPVGVDVGHTIRVEETARNAGGASPPATSSATGLVLPGETLPGSPSNNAPPTITGTSQQGKELTEHNGTWTGEPTSYAYQWLQCDSSGNGCKSISGATNQTYVPTAGDVGHTIKVEETASNAVGAGTPATSEPTAVIKPAVPVNRKCRRSRGHRSRARN